MSTISGSPNAWPDFFYGTAWKEHLTEACVLDALKAGFRAIDTANQRKHYYEEGAGAALIQAYSELGIKRENLFLQTKFTFARGQDHRKPYDEHAPPKAQVQQSFESSLEHLRTDYLDSYVLHGPSTSVGLTELDWETWKEMESICRAGRVKYLGISNVNFDQLSELHKKSIVKPTFVQNRCFAETRWDKEIRGFCLQNQIAYQGFSLLTANRQFLGGEMQQPPGRNIPQLLFPNSDTGKLAVHKEFQNIIEDTRMTIQQIIFRFANQVGMIPVIGTRSPDHMKLDLDICNFNLSETQIKIIENMAFLSP